MGMVYCGINWNKCVYLIGGACMMTIGAPVFAALSGAAATFALAYSAGVSFLGVGISQ